MKKLLLLGLLLALAGSANAFTCDFEGLPLDYYYFYGSQNIGGYYPGVTFGNNCYILDAVIGGYNSGSYPPHSWSAVAVSIGNDQIRADLASPASHVDVWYTSGSGSFYLDAYNSNGQLIASDNGPENTGATTNLSVDADGIAYVIMHDTGDYFVIDDFTFDGGGGNPTEETSWGQIKNLYK